MSLTWHGIRGHLARTSCTLSFKNQFDRIRQSCPSVSPFGDPAALLDLLNSKGGTPAQKNGILADLVRVAQTDGPASDCALNLLLLALWPALDAVRRRALARGVGTADEVSSDLLARATEAIRCLGLQRVTWVAATVQLNVQRDMLRARQRDLVRNALVAETNPDEVSDPQTRHAAPSSLALLTRDLLLVLGPDATLVNRVAIDGFTQAEAAKELGVTEDAARKRYQRAVKRLRAFFESLPD